MEEILFGLAFGQLLAVILVIALELLVSLAFWYFAELLWRGLIQGIRSFLAPFNRFGFHGGYIHAR